MLSKIAESIRTNKNILEKKQLTRIIEFIQENSYNKSTRIFSDLGEDSAAIKNNNKYILITTDRIKTEFLENFPYGAGFSAILVSVDDIYACGGYPLATSIILSYIDDIKGMEILKGICDGSDKFQVPIIRGHTNINGNYYELSSTMIGEINKEDYISAGNAQVGDFIILGVDFDGKIGKASKLYFDTTTFKTSEEVIKKRRSMNIIAKQHLANASKDVSNGGIFGTILQMIQYSKVGANINIKSIKIPPILKNFNYSLEIYSRMYLTTSFVLTAPYDNCEKILKIFEEHEMQGNIIGKVINEKNVLKITDEKETIKVFEF